MPAVDSHMFLLFVRLSDSTSIHHSSLLRQLLRDRPLQELAIVSHHTSSIVTDLFDRRDNFVSADVRIDGLASQLVASLQENIRSVPQMPDISTFTIAESWSIFG